MGKLNIIGVILITIAVNLIFVYVSYVTYNEFRFSILHVIFGLLPLILFLRKSKSKNEGS